MADKWPWLRNAPIIEGLVDINFAPLPQERLADLEGLQPELPDYPQRNYKIAFAAQVAMSTFGEANLSQHSGIIGYQYTSADGKRVFQARLNGVTLSFLAPYTRFPDLQAEAKRLWQVFSAKINPGPITRVALRYINRLELPLPFSDFREYILTVPDIAPTLPQNLAAFQMRLVIPDSETKSQAIVTEAFDGVKPDETELALFLDIDVFRMASAADLITDASLWNIVAEMRDFKNRIFFGTITDKMKGRYE